MGSSIHASFSTLRNLSAQARTITLFNTYATLVMLSTSIASTTNRSILQPVSLWRKFYMTGWSRRILVQLTVLLVGLFYSCAVLELDLGETGDSFGDVYDAYVPCSPVQTPKPLVSVYRKVSAVKTVVSTCNHPIVLSVSGLFINTLSTTALHDDSPLKHRRLQALYVIWRL